MIIHITINDLKNILINFLLYFH